ncbi:glycosyltransferase [Microlunatus spumicola]|uniref:Glycosyltransferase n=2 Tax=Microlunatus spumicola TaxID=81499 RepID=A0ABP6XZ59_9ACTN
MRVAMVGTRGVPARYGGFETCVEEVGRRLVEAGHEVVVYCRPPEGEKASDQPTEYLGMELVHLPAVRHRVLETLSHTAVSMLHPSISDVDCAIVFNAGNAPLIPVLRAHGIPVATHVDGLEWRRSKWSKVGRRYYRTVESLAVRWSDALIADAVGIADYYRTEFAAPTELIAYGAPILAEPGSDRIAALGLEPKGYHLVVARFEPENHVLEAVRGYVASNAELPLVVVGSSPYGMEYTAEIEAAANGDVRLLGAVWDQTELDQLYANALSYVHGHSVGGTNPSLLRAAGAGAYVIAYDCIFNREVLNGDGDYFRTPEELATLLEATEREPEQALALGSFARESIRRYDWDDVAARYEELCTRLVTEGPTRRRPSGRRVGTWNESAIGTDAAGPAATALPPLGDRPDDVDVHGRADARV